ncbi:hypothetical protein ACFQ8S_09665 [Streptomyces virginiae]|uniref:hypothetical protein n=1 Tax=Streptomyces virginiae TaxID=1961 RepID=UPI00369F2D7D
MASNSVRRAALALSAAALLGGLSVVPAGTASAASAQSDASVAAPTCSKGKNQTNGWGQCRGSGSYLWKVRVWCTFGGSGESSPVSGAGKTYAYCSWGNVNDVEIVWL